ncbi:MAG: GIY-YIG nuclease family protein [Planctomycetota bacterium]|jgi:site-specific DNA-methyltransferase (adenine-specific)
MKTKVRKSFLYVRNAYSSDRVVADPELNKLFVDACRKEGLNHSVSELNRCLINMRKASGLPGLKSRRTSFRNQDDYLFASEVAVRFLERRDGVTLDQIICDPVLVNEFDTIAERISPGYSSLQYRWAALYLRKRRKLCPETLGHVVTPVDIKQASVNQLDINDISSQQGLYIFFNPSCALYIGESKNLRNRIRKHIDHSDNKGLAYWLWQNGSEELHLEYHILDVNTSTRIRRAMEMELIRSREPLFNVSGVENP